MSKNPPEVGEEFALLVDVEDAQAVANIAAKPKVTIVLIN
jgi:hypothetical protein